MMRYLLHVGMVVAVRSEGFLDAPRGIIVEERGRRWKAWNERVMNALRLVLNQNEMCSPPYAERKKQKIKWCHVPKASSSFFTTVFRYGCIEDPDLYVGAQREGRRKNLEPSTMARYVERHCAQNHSFLVRKDDVVKTIASWATHEPVRGQLDSTVMIFRSPNQRILSAYNFGRHLWGGEMRGHGGIAPIGSKYYQEWRSRASAPSRSARDFAATPGVSACHTKMLMGCFCATRMFNTTLMACPFNWRPLDANFLYEARRKITNLAFVGIQDFYKESVCLFHRKFGGVFHPLSQLALFNLSPSKGGSRYTLASSSSSTQKRYNESDLRDFVDPIDEPLFASVLDRFITDLILYYPALRQTLSTLPRLPSLPEPDPPPVSF